MAARVGISARDVYSRVKPQGKADLVDQLQQQVGSTLSGCLHCRLPAEGAQADSVQGA